jgi:GcrA cell cycle regulator
MALLSKDYTDQLLAMWRAGMTAREIAASLGTTRNAVIGKIFRLRSNGVDMTRVFIPPPPKPVRQRKPSTLVKKVEPERPKAVWPPPLTEEQKAALIAERKAQMERERRPRGIKFAALGSRDCRYIINAGRPADYLFCGDIREPGKPYCKEHADLCYRPTLAK